MCVFFSIIGPGKSCIRGSLGPVINILAIFSNANVLESTTTKVSVVCY